jgi:acetyl-CoA C-acetyltransferase
MRDVAIVGAGLVPVQRKGGRLHDLALQSSAGALADAAMDHVDAVMVGNFAAGEFTGQYNLGPYIADQLHLTPAPALSVEAACASGNAALHMAYLGVASGYYDAILVTGVEHMSGVGTPQATRILSSASDLGTERDQGVTFTGLNAMLMRAYLKTHGVRHEDLMPFAVNAHKNGLTSPHAVLKKAVTLEEALASPVVADPLRLFDCSPICDGSASVVIASGEVARSCRDPVWIRGTAMASDTMSFHDRDDLLSLKAGTIACRRALGQAGWEIEDVDVYEVHDAFTIMTPLALESLGLYPRGQGWRAAADGDIELDGNVPISTFGGLKSRGHPVGATGLYQLVESVTQLRGRAGPNQVRDARRALCQNMGGPGSSIAVTLLEASA